MHDDEQHPTPRLVSFSLDPAQRRFERLVHQYQHRIYGFALYFLGRQMQAEDVTQEVLLKLWERLDQVDEERLLGWLLRVTRNACVDKVRKNKSYRKVVAQAPEDGLNDALGDDPTPEAEAEAADFQQHLTRALTRLAEPYRSIVILREVQDMKYEEISGAMDLPLNTVKVYLHRARKMLRSALHAELHGELDRELA